MIDDVDASLSPDVRSFVHPSISALDLSLFDFSFSSLSSYRPRFLTSDSHTYLINMPRLPVHREPKERQDGHTNGNANGNSGEKHPQLSTLQKHLVAASGEFCGTFMFLYFSFACQIMLHTQRSETSLENGGFSATMNIHTALVYGFSLLVNVWAFFRISGGLFNPAVSLAPSYRLNGTDRMFR